MRYTAKVSKAGRAWAIVFQDAPGCQTQAEREGDIDATAKEALEGWLEAWLADGDAPPRPKARAQGNLRVEVDPALAVAIEVRWARTRQKLTQAELGRRAGVSQQQIAKLERPGENPSIETLKKVSAALGARTVVTFEPIDTPRKRRAA